jgi:hypothetical protein
MIQSNPYWPQLEVDLSDTSGIIPPKGEDEAAYFEQLRNQIRQHATAPDWISATVMEPEFLDRKLGSKIAGFLLARSRGLWLVYVPEDCAYYCFWGTDQNNLGAHRESGNPLFCWWD